MENDRQLSDFSPMMQQYMKIKDKHKDALLFFRLGDFYELFFDDARVASEVLGLQLTSRETGQGKCPMCGLPHHAAEGYIIRLVEAGHKVALCEQVANNESKKGELLEREVVRVFTSGTIFDETKSASNYIAAIFFDENDMTVGLAYADVSTGDFYTTSLANVDKLIDELHKIKPREIIVNPDFTQIMDVKLNSNIAPEKYHFWAFLYDFAYEKLVAHFAANGLESLDLSNKYLVSACGALLQYLYETHQNTLQHIRKISAYITSDYMAIDRWTYQNLELAEKLHDANDDKGTLFWVMNQTKTPMGKRLLCKWMENPLMSVKDIATRQEAVGEFAADATCRESLREALGRISDMERLCGKLTYWRVTMRDFVALKHSISAIADVKRLLKGFDSTISAYFFENIDELSDVYERIQAAINDNAMSSENEVFADGYSVELDTIRTLKNQLFEALDNLEQTEKKSTGIRSLKVGQNKIFGYYIEIPNSQRNFIPSHYQRRQTLSSCERYVTDNLLKLQDEISNAMDSVAVIEQELWSKFRDGIAKEVPRLQLTAHMLATIDVLQSMGEIADKYNYTRPQISNTGAINITNGRHPVIERLSGDAFVPNNTYLDNIGNKIAIITGPNMAGKSTFLRQVALICIMAQMGSFVPADSASLPICDRVFTRVGASDDLVRGQSTFMKEMHETANILSNATHRSLIVLDEIGRGTGTVDGFSIALAVVEYIATEISAKTLFATHFHEMTAAEGKITGVANYRMEVLEDGENITFLHKVVPGGADKSYGIFVAKLAGLPAAVITRAMQVQKSLETGSVFEDNDNDTYKIDLDEINSKLQGVKRMFLEELSTFDENSATLQMAIDKIRRVKQAAKKLEVLRHE
ncbi:MAG: DNA mismatch repair protein MutS [Defluviitaleaceae bacterium]|nr:DNA mismatch repair protein MutS [Defluviitaleaceae bacterium]